jgi:hypothetical protein
MDIDKPIGVSSVAVIFVYIVVLCAAVYLATVMGLSF